MFNITQTLQKRQGTLWQRSQRQDPPNHWPLQVVYYTFRRRRKQSATTRSQITSFKSDYCSQPRPQRMRPLLEVRIIAFLSSLARLKIMCGAERVGFYN